MVRRLEGLGLLLVYLVAALAMGLCLHGPLVGYPRICGLLSQNLAIRISSQSHSCGACASSVSPQSPLPPNLQLHRASSSLCPPTLIHARTEAPAPGMCTVNLQ